MLKEREKQIIHKWKKDEWLLVSLPVTDKSFFFPYILNSLQVILLLGEKNDSLKRLRWIF